MAVFLKKNWKWFAIGTAAVFVMILGLLAFRVVNFVGGVTAERKSDVIPTADVSVMAQATATAQARLCAASIDCTTPNRNSNSTPNPIIKPTVVAALPTATPNITNSKIVQRIKAGEQISVVYMGYGGQGHEGEYLTDTILVLSFDPKTQTVAEYNIPRDLYLSVPGGPNGKTWEGKANGIFSTLMKWEKPTQDDLDPRYRWTNPQQQHEAAANLVANTVQGIVGFKIDYWVTMNFDAFRKLIDQMGGVTICVERPFTDTEYPRNDNDKLDAGLMTVSFKVGCQVMNGERAIQFARSRKSKDNLEGGDFARSARQMKVIQSIKEEILRRNLITNALSYMDALQGNFRVSMPADELFSLASYFNSAEGKSTISGIKFDPEIMTGNNFLKDIDKGGEIGYAVIPMAGQDKYSEIQTWIKKNFTFYAIRRENVRLQVLNSTGVSGKAGSLADYLADQGFRQADSEASALEDTTFLIDYTNGAATANLAQLKQFLPNIPVYTKTADKKPYDNAPDLMLYLGKDYKGISTGNAAPVQSTQK